MITNRPPRGSLAADRRCGTMNAAACCPEWANSMPCQRLGCRMKYRGVCVVALLVPLAVSILIASCGPGAYSGRSGDTGEKGDEGVAPSRKATIRVKVRDLSGGEAARCLGLEDEEGRLGAELETNEKETFAGLKHVHGPEFCATAYFTRNGMDIVRSYVAGSPLEGFVEVKAVETSLVKLEDARAGAAQIAGDLNELCPPNRTSFKAALREAGVGLPDHVALLGPEEPPRPLEESVPDPDVFLPRQSLGSGGGMMAVIRGELTLDKKGCLRIKGSNYDPVPVWPADFGINASEGVLQTANRLS